MMINLKKKKLSNKRRVKQLNRFVPIWRDYMGMYCFIKKKGLYNDFLNFYDNFSLEDIDDYKQKNRRNNRK